MKALVTGASGFIGSTLIEELNRKGIEPFALMRKSSSSSNLAGMKFQRVEGDLSNLDSLRKAVQGMDLVFHLAGATAAPNRQGYFEHNANGTQRLAQAVAEANPGLSRFVHVSSLAAAGPAQSLAPRTEDEQDRPVSAYGESKLAGEREVLKYKDTFPISIIRPPMVYGPKDKGVFVIIRALARGKIMPLLQGSTPAGHKYYSAIHSLDLCRGIIQAGAAKDDRSGEIFYLADGGVYTYHDLLSTIAATLKRKHLKVKVPRFVVIGMAAGLTAVGMVTRKTYPLNMDKLNELLPDYWICSNEKAKSRLGFKPEFDLATGMSDAIEWYKREKWL